MTTIESIVTATCAHFDIPRQDLLGPCRLQSLVEARHVAMYLAKELTPRSFGTIGRHFGGRDHSTVVSARRKVTRLLAAGDAETVAAVRAVREGIGAGERP